MLIFYLRSDQLILQNEYMYVSSLYSLFVCGIVECVLSGSDLLISEYECVYISRLSLIICSNVVL